MCGRYKQIAALQELADLFGIKMPRFSDAAGVATPGTTLPVIRGDSIEHMYWGYVPRWAKEGKPLVNCRSETVFEKPSFRDSVNARRCVILADGFFEWDRTQKPPQPFDIEPARVVGFAGIWDTFQGRDGFAVLTTAAVPAVAAVHDRMPVILQTVADCRRWLATPAASLFRGDDSMEFTLTPTGQFQRPANTDLPEDNNQLSLF
ncbi:MAG: SOS response-associated peptidase [bacterium]|nr:SOS response-associated peptidase [bacterium]